MPRKLTHEEFIAGLLIKNKYYANGDFIVTSKYNGKDKRISCHCNIHNCDWNPFASALNQGCGCPYCAGKFVVIGKTDLWTTRPDIAKLLYDSNDGYRYSSGSGRRTYFVCPICGNIEIKRIATVCGQGFSCKKCADGISYPNKFARALLDQLHVQNHMCEWQPDWAKPYFYDNYFEHGGNKYILEMDGGFHYNEFQYDQSSLEQVRLRDKIKDKMAIDHKINVIRVECLKSNCEYIKTNIMNSVLSEIFDLSFINWTECDSRSQNSLVKETCSMYKSGVHDFNVIGEKLHISVVTVQRYLSRGAKLNWCDYDPNVAKLHLDKNPENAIPIVVLDKYNNILYSFNSIKQCIREIRNIYGITIYADGLKTACRKHKLYHGLNFRFANETIQN